MGIYTYLMESDLTTMRIVKDPEVNALLQEALQHDRSLMIFETTYTIRRWFKKPVAYTYYGVKHEVYLSNGLSAMEARAQLSASGDKKVTIAYLYGIINGSLAANRRTTLQVKKS